MTIKLIRFLVVFYLLCLPGHSLLLAADAPVVLLWGDSLSSGYGIPREKSWATQLGKRLQARNLRLVNGSISGETSGGGLRRLPEALQQYAPAIVILELGGNDGLRGIPLQTLRKNMQAMVALALESNAQVLLLGMKIPPNYGLRYTREFEKIYADLAAQASVFLVPFFLQDVASDYELMQADGIHPTAEAQPRLLDNVWPTLKRLLH